MVAIIDSSRSNIFLSIKGEYINDIKASPKVHPITSCLSSAKNTKNKPPTANSAKVMHITRSKIVTVFLSTLKLNFLIKNRDVRKVWIPLSFMYEEEKTSLI